MLALPKITASEIIINKRKSVRTAAPTKQTLALKYGYDSPDSFTKAFTRFHGITPSMARKEGVLLKSFAPLKLTISLKGGYLMDYRITKKESFTVLGASRTFGYENAKQDIPAFTWAVFPCIGPMPDALQDINTRIFSEWLPALKEYEFAAGYCIEMYDRPDKYPKGTADENYRAEIWIPITRK